MSLWTAGMALGALLLARRVPAGALAGVAFAAVAAQGAALGLPALVRARRRTGVLVPGPA